MAKFTSPFALNLEYEGHSIVGPAGAVHRIPDSLQAAFAAAYGDRIHPTWVEEDEIAAASAGEGSHPDLAAHLALGLAAEAHDHDLSDIENAISALETDVSGKAATIHAHAYTGLTGIPIAFAPTSHAHVDDDLPAGIARDSEVTAAIASHESTATHGGGASLPAGVIVMWGGAVSAIPDGWLLCNGSNGTPDLRSRFIKGAAAGSDPGATGGSATHTHAAHTDAINHTHSVSVTDPGHTHDQMRFPTATGGSTGFTVDTSMSGTPAAVNATGSRTTGITASTANPAGGVASLTHDSPNSEPPYYALAFIQKQ